MIDLIMTLLTFGWLIFMACVLMIALLCLGNSKECYQCGERLERYNTKKYRVSSNKGFCGSHCKDIYKRDLAR